METEVASPDTDGNHIDSPVVDEGRRGRVGAGGKIGVAVLPRDAADVGAVDIDIVVSREMREGQFDWCAFAFFWNQQLLPVPAVAAVGRDALLFP